MLDIPGIVSKNGPAALMAQVVGEDQVTLLLPADIQAAQYTIYELDDSDVNAGTPVVGHSDVVIADAAGLFLDPPIAWDKDATGYNFFHRLDTAEHPAFPKAGKKYRIWFTITPKEGSPFPIRFKVSAL